ncbi:MAG: transglycosylase, partial [Phycisphaerales bacterium]|nr:transglycosylase [Phycisphaerales bacterium]
IGAVIGGWLFRVLGMHGVTGFNLWSLLVAVLGAVVLLLIWHGIRGDFHGRPMH